MSQDLQVRSMSSGEKQMMRVQMDLQEVHSRVVDVECLAYFRLGNKVYAIVRR